MVGNKYVLQDKDINKRTYYFFKKQWEDNEGLIWVTTNVIEIVTDRNGMPHTLYFDIANDIDLPVHVAKKFAANANQLSEARYNQHMAYVNKALESLEQLTALNYVS